MLINSGLIKINNIKLLKGATIYSFGRVFKRVITAVQNFLFAFLLGPQAYGLFSIAYTAEKIIRKFTMVGQDKTIIKFTPPLFAHEDHSAFSQFIKKSLSIATIVSGVITFLIFILSPFVARKIFNNSNLILPLRLIILMTPFVVVNKLLAVVFRAIDLPLWDAFSQYILLPLLWFASGLLGFFLFGSLNGLISLYCLGGLFSFIICVTLFFLKKPFKMFWRDSKTTSEINIFGYSLIVLLISHGGLLLNRIDRIMLGIFNTAAGVGIYNIAALLGIQTSFMLGSFDKIFAPKISSLYEQGEHEKLNEFYQTITRWITTFSLPIPIFFYGWGKEILSIPGKEYSTGYFSLLIISIGFSANFLVGSAEYLLLMTSNHKWEFLNTVILNILNIVLNLMLIPKFGIEGAALSTGLSAILINLARLLEVKFVLGYWPYTIEYIKPLITGCILLLVINFVHQYFYWFFGLPFFYSLYALAIFYLGLTPEDQKIWEIFKEKIVSTG